MLESIKVTEQLHWPEVDLSKKSIFNSANRVVSPTQVCFATIPSPAFEDLLLQTEEEEKKQKEKESQCKKPKPSMKGGLALSKRNRVILAQKQTRSPDGGEKPVQTNCVHSASNCNLLKPTLSLTVVGSKMGLIPRTASLLRKTPSLNAYRPALSSPYNAATSREAENAKKLCIFTAIKPCNVDREKDKFFKSDFSYNPQFEYSNPASAGFLARHNHASSRFLAQAVNIMELALKRYGSYEIFEQVTGGNLLPRSRIWINVKRYMEKEGCVGEIVVQVTDDLLSRASMTMVNGQPTMTINTSSAREHWLEGMLRHEIAPLEFGSQMSPNPKVSNAEFRHSLLPRPQQLPAAMGQQHGEEEAQPEASEPNRGGPGQHPQRSVQEGPHSVACRAALLYRLSGQAHVLHSALPQPGTLCSGPTNTLGLLCPCQERPDQHSYARVLQ
ncbi:uncharacterized protein KIAA0895 isoform X2 [Poecilia formosa]|uniref:uncharacterized protein KIAA0895 isoform X2 n=1 Tax=Poecilia formosa TaxID=48698 RepID=UPI0004446170|nr:PREDICTED: uncharacterized protein KIAA0895 homolog isoform X2 [Poecilia formosa]